MGYAFVLWLVKGVSHEGGIAVYRVEKFAVRHGDKQADNDANVSYKKHTHGWCFSEE